MSSSPHNTFFNLPNLITLARIALIPPFLVMIVSGRVFESFLIFLVAGCTDVLDGQLARLLRQKTKIGTILDPTADKLLMTSAYITLTLPALTTLNTLPIWLTATVVGRDALIGIGYFVISRVRGIKTVSPTILGKTSTVFQIGTVLLVLLFNYLQLSPAFLIWLYFLTLTFTLLSGIHYFITYAFLIPFSPSHGKK